MDFREFMEKYSLLNYNHQHIVFETLRRMQHTHTHKRINNIIHNKIKQQQRKKNIGYKELYRKLNEELNDSVSEKTFESFMYRKSIKKDFLILICKILEIPDEEIKQIKNAVWVQSSDTTDIKWLYNSLSNRNKKVIYYLTYALYMDEHYPEVFMKNEDYM